MGGGHSLAAQSGQPPGGYVGVAVATRGVTALREV